MTITYAFAQQNDKRKSKSKFEMKSINFVRKRAMKKRGEKGKKQGGTKQRNMLFWGDRTREQRSSFYHFTEHEPVDSSNEQQTKRGEEN